MQLLHNDRDFPQLVRMVAVKRRLPPALIEKDYWVTHALWSMHQLGLEIWFKGGTSLAKGFDLITRFSEDLDLKITPGARTDLPAEPPWKSEGKTATAARRDYFHALAGVLRIRDAQVRLNAAASEPTWRGAHLQVVYPGAHAADLQPPFRPYVLLEVGDARVVPFVERSIGSFVHTELEARGMATAFDDNRPRAVRCVHPHVTLWEKLDALQKRAMNDAVAPAMFVRHFEDAARIIEGAPQVAPLPAPYASPADLAAEMARQRQIRSIPTATDAAFRPQDSSRWEQIRAAYDAIAPMFWGPRSSLDEACATVRDWLGLSEHSCHQGQSSSKLLIMLPSLYVPHCLRSPGGRLGRS